MKTRTIKSLLVLTFASSLLVGCGSKNKEENKEIRTRYVVNGGFESSDLSGWTIEYGDAYNDDSVSSRENFYFKNDAQHNVIDVNKTGNWYLSGKGFDLKHSHGRVGAIRSNNFFFTGCWSLVFHKIQATPTVKSNVTIGSKVFAHRGNFLVSTTPSSYDLAQLTHPITIVTKYTKLMTLCPYNFDW